MITNTIVFLLLVVSSATSFARETHFSSYYPYLENIYNGPIQYHKDISNPHDQGVQYRAVVILEEANYSLIIERFTIGDEGVAEFHSAKSKDIGWNSNSKFLKWINTNRFEAMINDEKVVVKIGSDGYPGILNKS